MAEWQQLLQSIIIGLLFSYLLAKLISIVVSFKDDNLTVTRHADPPVYQTQPKPKPKSQSHHDDDDHDYESSRGPDLGINEADSVIAEHGSVRNESVAGSDDHLDDDDDWEGVESTELDEAFSAATAFVAAAASDRLSQKVSNDVQLQLYGLYKIATEGPCSAPPPSAIKMTARAKWYYFHIIIAHFLKFLGFSLGFCKR